MKDGGGRSGNCAFLAGKSQACSVPECRENLCFGEVAAVAGDD